MISNIPAPYVTNQGLHFWSVHFANVPPGNFHSHPILLFPGEVIKFALQSFFTQFHFSSTPDWMLIVGVERTIRVLRVEYVEILPPHPLELHHDF